MARIQALLVDYINAILKDGTGSIESVIVTAPQTATQVCATAVTAHTERRGSSHLDDSVIFGQRPHRVAVTMVLDTDASPLVLPQSMMEELGYCKEPKPQAR